MATRDSNSLESSTSSEMSESNFDSHLIDSTADETIEEIQQLLSEADSTPHDTAFPDFPGLDRRADQRHPFLAEIVVVLPHAADSDEPFVAFRTIQGWTTDLSPRSVGFVLPEELQIESLLLLINHPDYSYPRCCFSARIFRHRQRSQEEWEYGAILRPMFDAESIVPSLFRRGCRISQ
jgi:hypothetical protein